MRKLYLFTVLLFGTFSVNAQLIVTKEETILKNRNEIRPVLKNKTNAQKAEGDVAWSNGFDTPTQWVQTTGAGHTGGDWEIVNSLPSNITSQQASYQWPATFSAATGNFALINSDLAGGAAAQDAYFEYNGTIDLSALGNAVLSVQFNEYYRNYYDQTFIEVSNDNGVTWTIFEVNPVAEVPVNTNCISGEMEVVNITSAKGAGTWTSQVKFRFHYIGQWDWFWGIDNLEIVESWNNDIKVNNWYQSTPVASSFGLDYYHIPASQVSFPGITFGANVINNGALDQSSVLISATGTGGYSENGTSISINSGVSDSLELTVPYMPSGLGTKTISLTTTLTGADSDNSNNVSGFDMFLTQYEFSRDNNILSGSIGQISSQDGQALKIGNVMEVFNDFDVTAVKLYLSTQAAGAVGAEYRAEIYKFNGVDTYDWLGETEIKTVVSTTAGWVQLLMVGGPISLLDGDDILVVASHFGGTDEVRFGLAQNTVEETVLGFDVNGDLFSLSSPSAVMIRLLDDPSVKIEENTLAHTLNVYPNPANSSAVVSMELSNEADVVINITDLSGKVVYTNNLGNVNGAQKVTVNTDALTSGVYMVNVTVDGTVSTQKLVVRK